MFTCISIGLLENILMFHFFWGVSVRLGPSVKVLTFTNMPTSQLHPEAKIT